LEGSTVIVEAKLIFAIQNAARQAIGALVVGDRRVDVRSTLDSTRPSKDGAAGVQAQRK